MHAIWSEHWHAVRFLRPRLRDGVKPLHRRLRGRPWVLLADPVTQRFHRLSPGVWRVLELLDGRKTLDEVWATVCAGPAASAAAASAPDASASVAISQQELVQLLASLHANDLLQSQVAPDAGEVLERHQRHDRQRWKQTWLNPLNIRLPLLHPDAWFDRHAALGRGLVGAPFLTLWFLIVAPAAVLAWQHWFELTENLSDRVLAASNLVLLWFTYPAVKAVHECAHGLVCRAYGGTVREIGVMFMVLTPVPYVDATSSYAFASKWQRAFVAAAGIMAELLLGAIALYVWLTAEAGLVSAIAFNVVMITGASTLLVNGNPLMRYDGYFIVCDLLEVPNLAQRAAQYWTYLIDRRLFGSLDARPPLAVRGERLLLAFYGLASPAYRLFITFGLIWFVATEYLFVGAVMAVLALWGAVALPLWRAWKHVADGASLARRREIARRRSVLLIVGGAAVFCLVPLPFHSVHQAVVWVPDEAIVRAESPGQVVDAPVEPGTRVEAGRTLLVLDNPALAADAAGAAAALALTEARLRQAESEARAKVPGLRGEAAAKLAKLRDAQTRLGGLAVRPAAAGRWVPKQPTRAVGRYVRRGEVVGWVVAGPSSVLRCALPQEDTDLVRSRLRAVEVLLAQRPRDARAATISRVVPGGEFELVSPALGTSGGGDMPVDPSMAGGTRALERVFDIELALARPSPSAVFGDRAWVRFDLGPAPLAWQWFLRLRQLFLARLGM